MLTADIHIVTGLTFNKALLPTCYIILYVHQATVPADLFCHYPLPPPPPEQATNYVHLDISMCQYMYVLHTNHTNVCKWVSMVRLVNNGLGIFDKNTHGFFNT